MAVLNVQTFDPGIQKMCFFLRGIGMMSGSQWPGGILESLFLLPVLHTSVGPTSIFLLVVVAQQVVQLTCCAVVFRGVVNTHISAQVGVSFLVYLRASLVSFNSWPMFSHTQCPPLFYCQQYFVWYKNCGHYPPVTITLWSMATQMMYQLIPLLSCMAYASLTLAPEQHISAIEPTLASCASLALLDLAYKLWAGLGPIEQIYWPSMLQATSEIWTESI